MICTVLDDEALRMSR